MSVPSARSNHYRILICSQKKDALLRRKDRVVFTPVLIHSKFTDTLPFVLNGENLLNEQLKPHFSLDLNSPACSKMISLPPGC